MAINKVVYDGNTLVDLTSDTVKPEVLSKGYTAHGADGEPIVGTMDAGAGSGGGDTSTEDAFVTNTLTEYKNERVTEVGQMAFYSAPLLTSVEFPNVKTIGASAFQSCTKLASVRFPEAETVSSQSFHSCTALKIDGLSFPKIVIAGSYSFGYCNFGNKIERSYFPSLERIEMYCFNGVFNKSYGATAYFDNLKYIASRAFQGAARYDSNRPPNIIGYYGLSKLYLYNTKEVCELANVDAFVDTPLGNGSGYIYVPETLLEEYKKATNWSNFATRFVGIAGL